MAGATFAIPSDILNPTQEKLVRDELDRVCANKLFIETTPHEAVFAFRRGRDA